MKKIILVGWGVILSLSIFSFNPMAKADEYIGVKVNDCIIKDFYDGFDGRKSITLRDALYYAGKSTVGDQRCRKSITIEASTINLEKPLEISVKNTSAASVYVIRGAEGGNVGIPVKLDFAKLKASQNSDPAKNCAIHFKGTHDILLKDISIENIPAGFSAICVENNVNHIVLDNVHVANVAGNGIVFFANSSNSNRIEPNSSLEQISGDGILILNTDPLANNALKATSRTFGPEGITSADGTANFAEAAEPKDFVMSQVGLGGNKFIRSAAPVKILFNEINTTGEQDKFIVRGAVLRTDETDHSCLPYVVESSPNLLQDLESRLTRLQVYAVGGGSDANATFLTYVTKQSECADPAGCLYGIQENTNSTGSVGNFNGIFSFILDKKKLLDRINKDRTDAEKISDITKIIVVPELEDTVTSASEPQLIQSGPTAELCEGEVPGDAGSSLDQYGFIRLGWKTKSECKNRSTKLHPPLYDSDGDGLYDHEEDLDGDCEFDQGLEYSSWMTPDTDGDGISDNAERIGASINKDRFKNGNWDLAEHFCDKEIGATIPKATDDPATGADESSPADFCDVDGDGASNADDTDSDLAGSECLPDYKEDRARLFVAGAKAHFSVWDGIGGLIQYLGKDSNGQEVQVECDLYSYGKQIVGAKYGLFKVKKDRTGTPVEYTSFGGLADDEGLMPLVCRNDSVRSETNFNGRYEFTEGETHLYVKDTTPGDGADDCVCRGTLNGSVCDLGCVPYEIFKVLPNQYVNLSKTALLTDESGTTPLLYKQSCTALETLCSDIDGDRIPDCVENASGECNFSEGNNNGFGAGSLFGRDLNPYRKDSDGDSLVDGVSLNGNNPDKCPFDDGEDCDQRNVYAHRPVFACFFDRDKDGLRDAEEDFRNQAGEFIPDGILQKVGGLAGRVTTETDPLDDDTDGDGVGDAIEIQSWNRYTNASDPDTDFDSLSDGFEVKDYNVSPDKAYSDQGSANKCSGFVMVSESPDSSIEANRIGTDPAAPDTDGDGIPDGVEVRGNKNGEISLDELTAGLLQGFDLVSNPLSLDSDGDGLNDLQEYGTDGVMSHIESNPCDSNTDNDSRSLDSEEPKGCATNPDANCVANESGFLDSDTDGLPDSIEAKLGTNPNLKDTDGDDIEDGDEDINHDGIIQLSQGETDPRVSDTDLDGLDDGQELKLGTFANKADTDSDCILDGVEVNFNEFSSFTGTDTNPTSPDSDGDGLCDGNNAQTNGGLAGDISCIRGEDVNCNGKVDPDPKNPDRFAETDPRNPDTDSDGIADKTEVCAGGRCDLAANIGHATLGAPSGCFSLAPVAPLGSSSMLYVYGLLLIVNRMMVRKKRHSVRSKCHPERSEGSR